jgi:hypothetical protein
VKFNGADASVAEVVTACTNADGNYWALYDADAGVWSFSSILTSLRDANGDVRGPGHMYTPAIANCATCHSAGGVYGPLFQPAPSN